MHATSRRHESVVQHFKDELACKVNVTSVPERNLPRITDCDLSQGGNGVLSSAGRRSR